MRHLLLLAGLLPAALPLAGLVSAAATAQVAPDRAPLSVTPPPGYTVEPSPPREGQAARFSVKRPTDKDTGCQVAFTPTRRNEAFSQAQLDATMRGEQWQQAAKRALSAAYDVKDASVTEGPEGVTYILTADFKERPGLPERARDVRTLFSIRETPRGRTSTVCVGDKTDFAGRQAEFAAVAAGAKGP